MEPSAAGTPTLQTDYNYDALGNLLSVNQNGASGETAHNRSFTYDSLSRLLCSSNPESSVNSCPSSAASALPSGVVSYNYDPNGNMQAKTDARGVVTTYSYDPLNRIAGKTYTNDLNSTPATCFMYDTPLAGTSPANSIGRITASWTQAEACPLTGGPTGSYQTMRAVLGYDALGHITSEQQQQCFAGKCAPTQQYQMNYSYDMAGNRIDSDNGLGTVAWQMTYDVVGRLNQVYGLSASSGPNFPSSLFNATTYNAIGLTNWTMGPNVNSSGGQSPALTFVRSYDNRMRVASESINGQH